jgi:iron complex outermembrane receptor protein
LEWEHTLGDVDVSIGLARRDKNQKANFDFGGFPNYSDADLEVTSFTPRLRVSHSLGGDSSLVLGIDVHRWNYARRISNAPTNIGQPINRVSMRQRNEAVYLQNTSRLSSATNLLVGVRNERITMRGSDIYDATAPGPLFGSVAPAASFSDTKNAYDLGLRHQLDSKIVLSGKIGRSFRFANVDEIYESGVTFSNQFQFLKPQTVDGIEFSVAQQRPSAIWRATLFRNRVSDEIHLDPFTTGVGNTNLPPSRRQGVELDGKWQALPQLALNAAYAYTDARFLSGVLPGSAFSQLNINIAGKYVPLVARHKANLGAAWTVSEQTHLNTALTYVGSQFMENDEGNTLRLKIPAYALVDVKLVHKMRDWQFSTSVNNLFDRNYFNYAISSQFTAGRYNAFTLPGRTIYFELNRQM